MTEDIKPLLPETSDDVITAGAKSNISYWEHYNFVQTRPYFETKEELLEWMAA